MADRGRTENGEDPFPDIPKRPTLRLGHVDPDDDAIRSAIRTLADNQAQMVQRLAEQGADLRSLGVATADGFLKLERKIENAGPRQPPHFEPDEPSSYNELSSLFGEAGAELYKRMKDPRDKLDSVRARAIALEAIETAKNADAAATLDRMKADSRETRRQIRNGVIIGITVGAVLAAGGFLWGAVRVQAAHDLGVAEERSRIETAPPPSATVTAPAMPSPTAPAAVAPKR